METIILVLSIGIMNILCFFIGAKVGQKVVKGEDIKLPNPIKAIEETKDTWEFKKEQEEENERLKIQLENIDNYNGTPLGQKDIF